MKKEITLKFYDNESHGYIKISKYDLEAFDIDIKQFSQYLSSILFNFKVSGRGRNRTCVTTI